MSLLKHVYAIKTILSAGHASDDFRFTDSFIAHHFTVAVGKLLEEKLKQDSHISELAYQTYCEDLVLSDTNCCELPFICKRLRTQNKIPDTLSSKLSSAISVYLVDGTEIPMKTVPQSKLSEYALIPQELSYYIENGYVWINGSVTLPKILIKGLFLENVTKCTSEDLDSCEDTFYVEKSIADSAYTIVINRLFQSFRTENDITNNHTDLSKNESDK